MNPQYEPRNQDVEPTISPTPAPEQNTWQTLQPATEPWAAEMEPSTGEQVTADPLGSDISAAPATSVNAFAQPVEQPAETTPAAAAPLAPAAKKLKKPLLLSLIIGGAVLLLGGTAAAYQFWYQNPDKVVTDSFVNALTAKTMSFNGAVDTSGEAAKLKIDFDGASNDVAFTTHAKATLAIGAVNVVVDGNVQTSENGDMYFKLANAKDIAAIFTQMMGGGEANPEFNALVDKINNKWIKVTPKDLDAEKGDEATNQAQCFSDAVKKLRTDKSLNGELTDLYKKQRFVTIKESLGTKNGNLGYKLDIDRNKAKEFILGVEKTKFHAELKKCDSEFKLDTEDITKAGESDITGDTEVWVSQWAHELKQVKFSGSSKDGSSKGTFVFNPVFNKPVNITAPADALTLQELQKEIEAVSASVMGVAYQGIQSRADASKSQAAAALVVKKAETFNAVEAHYPTLSELLSGSVEEAKLDESIASLLVAGQPTSADQIGYQTCSPNSDGVGGAIVSYIDATSGNVATITAGAC
jgi:hypothetical protein